jgi:hypothetical protein
MAHEKVYNIFWDEKNRWITMEWDGYATSAQFIEGTELMYRLMVEHKTSKVFADIKDMTLIGREDQNYVIYSFLPRAIQAGFRAIAIVKPVSYFNAVAIETMGYRVNETAVQMKVFDNRDQAVQWLRETQV